jgi:hypothetical protein
VAGCLSPKAFGEWLNHPDVSIPRPAAVLGIKLLEIRGALPPAGTLPRHRGLTRQARR